MIKRYYTDNSREVQQELFKAGYRWLMNEDNVAHLKDPYVCFSNLARDHLTYLTSKCWADSDRAYIHPSSVRFVINKEEKEVVVSNAGTIAIDKEIASLEEKIKVLKEAKKLLGK